ncbi:MAG: hypothetical protein ACPGSC_05345 [Granulosicoccaceae bacterium]
MNLRLLSLSAAAACISLLSACQSTTPLTTPSGEGSTERASVAEMGGNLFRAVEEHVRSQGSILDETPHQTAYTDLNNDGMVDVLLMLNSPEWCIGESCTMMIFEGTTTGARLLSELTLISSPVSIGEVQEGGWRDVYVTLPGAAGRSTMAKVSHNGGVYPESPSNWSFLASDQSIPGRAVMVGGGASGNDLADFDKLLADMDTSNNTTAAMTVAESGSGEQSFYGRYSWGPGEAYFRPCGGSSVYWVTSSESVSKDLDQRYRQIASLQFDDVYLEMKGRSEPAPSEGEASFYDGVLEVEKVLTMEAVNEDTCSQAPSS